MKYFSIVIILLSFFFASCSEDSIDTYGVKEYVYFPDTIMNYSFAFDPDLNAKEILVELKLIGNQKEYDRELSIAIDSMSSNLLEDDYEILSSMFRANMFQDTIRIRVNKLSGKDKVGFIRFVIKENQYFKPGPTKNMRFSLTFSDELLFPDWWDTNIERNYLGTYSEKKYREFIKATGIHDMSGLGSSERRAYTLVFKKYIKDNDIREADGSPMTVTIKE